ncbi:MAG: hypothetical protein NC094_02455 [Bacteroidales bacterium]|nr:hypothetical protein [Lachnoclostridium sp.]MCM1383412.1 hypothetical protein [Lachnoclostridium sp.]MCM1464260.1 hypothetical protein [Bacteroidales bacterium]
MDTILYFYPLKHETSKTAIQCKVTESQFPIYHLVKIGMPPGAVSLLQDTFEEAKAKERNSGTEVQKESLHKKENSPKKLENLKFWNPFARRKQKKEWEMRRQELLDSIFKLWGESCSSYCVCQPPITYFDKWKFTDYREEKWADYLMRYGSWSHYVVLGNAPCLGTLLPKYVKKMKSLRLFLKESEFDEGLEEVLDLLFEEYGLAADIQFLEEDAGYKKLPIFGAFPCNVLDFSGEEKVLFRAAAPGSVWLDFDGLEEKRRRSELRGSAVHYFSLVKEWKTAIQFCTES